MISSTKTYQDSMQQIADDFFASTGNWRATASEIAVWAIHKGLWEPPRQMAIKVCARDISRAMREEHIKDGDGRLVRAKHAARITQGQEQKTFWADIRIAPREHIELALQQRRRQIVGDCRQLKIDQDFYNDGHPNQEKIQLCFDFRDDLAELEAIEDDENFRRKPR